MFGRSRGVGDHGSRGEVNQPLLRSSLDENETPDTVFAVDEDEFGEDDDDDTPLARGDTNQVRFNSQPQVMPLRSTMASREAGTMFGPSYQQPLTFSQNLSSIPMI
jgi:hypothetical protein